MQTLNLSGESAMHWQKNHFEFHKYSHKSLKGMEPLFINESNFLKAHYLNSDMGIAFIKQKKLTF